MKSGVRRRGPRPSLSLDVIGRAALRIADADGLDGVTVRRLAQELGVGVMTLYGYVRTKDEILDALAEAALGELRLPSRGNPDRQLERLFMNLHQLLIEHPSVAYLYALRPLTGRAGLRISDRVLGLLSEGGLPPAAAFAAQRALTSYTVGAALYHVGAERSRVTVEHRAHVRVLAEEFPNVRRHLEQLETERSADVLARECRNGLRSLLAGIWTQAGAR